MSIQVFPETPAGPVVTPDPGSGAVIIPSPNVGKGGALGWIVAHFKPFANSLYGFASLPEINATFRVAAASGVSFAVLSQIAISALTYWGPQLPMLAPFVGSIAAFMTAYMGLHSKAAESTDADGRPTPAVVLPSASISAAPIPVAGASRAS